MALRLRFDAGVRIGELDQTMVGKQPAPTILVIAPGARSTTLQCVPLGMIDAPCHSIGASVSGVLSSGVCVLVHSVRVPPTLSARKPDCVSLSITCTLIAGSECSSSSCVLVTIALHGGAFCAIVRRGILFCGCGLPLPSSRTAPVSRELGYGPQYSTSVIVHCRNAAHVSVAPTLSSAKSTFPHPAAGYGRRMETGEHWLGTYAHAGRHMEYNARTGLRVD